ncbi:fasciclin domain-containing protein [uncultured Winogradskyella sp.]|jgi:hypothetical protein|uniref:fasciclin domain-containing protein n=1 Tax=uncultured Winogradskyella sp. TaxID=395353 RepID=UPI0025DF2880|nr:fasciclin domain-containing protein [uncultured Winogradskyella sp.]
MKKISNYFKLLPVFLLILILTACSDDDYNNPPTTTTVVDVVDGAGNDAGIIAVDVQTSNGVIHVVNAVLLPAS